MQTRTCPAVAHRRRAVRRSLIAFHGAVAVAAPQVIATIALPDPVRWDYVTVDPLAHLLYVAHRERVDVIDTRDNKPVLQLGPAPGVHGAAAAPDLDRVFTSNGADGTVGVFDATSGKLLQAVKAGKNPDAIVYEPVTHRVFAFNGGSSDVTAIDARSLKVLAASDPGGRQARVRRRRWSWPCLLPHRGQERTRRPRRADPADPTPLQPRALRGAERPGDRPERTPVLRLPQRRDGRQRSDRGRVIGQAPIGHGADGVAWLDGKAYSANGQDGTISVIAESSRRPLRDDRNGADGARGADDRCRSQRAHAVHAHGGLQAATCSDAARAGRPESIPGTFRVLVLRDADALTPRCPRICSRHRRYGTRCRALRRHV